MKAKVHIPLHLTQTHLKDSFFVKQYEEAYLVANDWIKEMHRDEYFLFLLIKTGSMKFEIDFQKMTFCGPSIFFVKPGQVHAIDHVAEGTSGWSFAVEPGFLHQTYLQGLDAIVSPIESLEHDSLLSTIEVLENMAFVLTDSKTIPQLKRDVVNSMVGIVMACLGNNDRMNAAIPVRWMDLYRAFRTLVEKSYATIKMPSEYAEQLHVSLSYLNEIVKSVSSFSVSYWINYEIVLEAKRLLHYTQLTIKEISYALGYEDPAYFSRIFSRSTGISPNTFRKKNRG